jgi:ribokinase
LRPVWARRGRGSIVVLGAINWDVTIFERDFPRAGEEVPVLNVVEGPGGKGANVAVAAARILGPGVVSFVGAVGDDDVSRRLVSGLNDEGVSTDGVAEVRGRSGRAYIIVDSRGAKTIHTHFGANNALDHGRLNSAARSALEACSAAVVMDLPLAAAASAASVARRSGADVAYSPGVRAAAGYPNIGRVLDSASTLVVNEAELGRLFPGLGRMEALARLKSDRPGLAVVATRGPDGCSLVTEDGVHEVRGVDLADLGLEQVNSTGSGDAFLGALASYMFLGLGAEESAPLANLAGALKTSKADTRGSPTRAELKSAEAKLRRLRQWPLASRRSRA